MQLSISSEPAYSVQIVLDKLEARNIIRESKPRIRHSESRRALGALCTSTKIQLGPVNCFSTGLPRPYFPLAEN
jgi:hypothetical protein